MEWGVNYMLYILDYILRFILILYCTKHNLPSEFFLIPAIENYILMNGVILKRTS